MAVRWPPNLYIFLLLFGSTDGAVELAPREIKYTRKTGKSAFRKIFVARYIPILQYFLSFLQTLTTFLIWSLSIIKISLTLTQSISDLITIKMLVKFHLNTVLQNVLKRYFLAFQLRAFLIWSLSASQISLEHSFIKCTQKIFSGLLPTQTFLILSLNACQISLANSSIECTKSYFLAFLPTLTAFLVILFPDLIHGSQIGLTTANSFLASWTSSPP